MVRTRKVLVVVNSTCRQAAGVVRVAAAIGYTVHAHVRSASTDIAAELGALHGVTLMPGSLENPTFVKSLFNGAQFAFVNTLPLGNEGGVGKLLADTAKEVGLHHFIYSSLPDHSLVGGGPKLQPAVGLYPLPQWSTKWTIESYIRSTGIPATFVYVGTYLSNFTTRPSPLFGLSQNSRDGSYDWICPFPPDFQVPLIDTDHDMGPAVIQLFKDGPKKWSGKRVPLFFELLTPPQIAAYLTRGMGRPVHYHHQPSLSAASFTGVPPSYTQDLQMMVHNFKQRGASYFGGTPDLTGDARALWEGWRGTEEYAREVWPSDDRPDRELWVVNKQTVTTAPRPAVVQQARGVAYNTAYSNVVIRN